jgi:hypothetical protein
MFSAACPSICITSNRPFLCESVHRSHTDKTISPICIVAPAAPYVTAHPTVGKRQVSTQVRVSGANDQIHRSDRIVVHPISGCQLKYRFFHTEVCCASRPASQRFGIRRELHIHGIEKYRPTPLARFESAHCANVEISPYVREVLVYLDRRRSSSDASPPVYAGGPSVRRDFKLPGSLGRWRLRERRCRWWQRTLVSIVPAL